MNGHALQMELVRWIQGILRQGLVLSEDVARYMESAFGTRHLGAVLSQSHDSETDSLLELLCYPDQQIQARFESRWGHQAFTPRDLAAAVDLLISTPLTTTILSPQGAPLGAIEIPPFALEAFVRRLNATWQPPPRLARALEQLPADDRGLAVRVHLRNARLPWHADQVCLMTRYLEKMPVGGEPFETGLVFLTSILWELGPGADAYDFLIAKKFFYFQSLRRAEDFERKRLSSNMEIIILQGARAAHGSIEEWRRNMRQIDLICQALFGRTEFFQQPGEYCLDADPADANRQIQDVMRLLS